MPAGDDSAFQETTEGVKAKLNVEVPEQALTTLAALSKQMESFRINMEAASRAQGDHQGYLERAPQITDLATERLKQWCDQVEQAIDLKGKLGDLGSGIPGSVGQDSANPFGPGTLGRGDVATLLAPFAAGDKDRLVSMANQKGMIDHSSALGDEQINKIANALAQAVNGEAPDNTGGGGGGARPKTPGRGKQHAPEEDEGLSPQRLEEGALKGRDLIGNILGEIGPGRSIGDALGGAKDALGGLEGAGGTLGKVAGALGPVGAGVGLALTANQLLQMGGQQVQQYRQLGQETGGGFGEGLGYDAKAKMLALDPFITTAQAREVIQGSLNAGMGGDSFDSVTGFIAKNLKDMNLQVSDSVKLLQDNVEKGGMSIDQLGASLANVQSMAKGAAQGASELQANFGANTAALTDIGVSGPQGTIATQFMGMFKDSPLLANVGSDILQGALGNPIFQSSIAAQQGLGGGITPDVAMQKLANSGQLPQAVMGRLAELAKRAQASTKDPDQAANIFMRWCASIGFQIGPNEARGLYQELIKPGGAQAALAQGDDATKASLAPIDTSVGGQLGGQLTSEGNSVQNMVGGVFNIGKDLLSGNLGAIAGDTAAVMGRKGEIDRQHEADTAQYTNDALKKAVGQYGTDNLQVYDASGKNAQKLDQSNKEQRDKLASGELLIAARGGTPQKLQNFGVGDTPGGQTAVNVSASPITVKYEGPISGPTSVPLTTNQQRANTGYGGATVNKPPPESTR